MTKGNKPGFKGRMFGSFQVQAWFNRNKEGKGYVTVKIAKHFKHGKWAEKSICCDRRDVKDLQLALKDAAFTDWLGAN
jgi:hypothetical protein